MKRNRILNTILVVACCVFVACSSDSNNPDPEEELYIAIPDADFETKLIEQGIDSDGVLNKKILKSDAEKITRLDLNLTTNFGKIADLTGIEGFVNLKLLSAANQEIEDIDLSANTLLDTIYLIGNRLTSIDLSKNTNLIFVDLQSNLLTSISGISELSQLKKLDVSWNNFEQLTVENESIEVLNAGLNLLTSLNVEGSVSLKYLLLSTNKLATIDLSSNALLEILLISDNKLQTINLENNGKLTHLYISSNLLSDLDLTHNLDLVEIKVDRNESLSCIKILSGQTIPSVSLSDYQDLKTVCN
ncbi:hypothetical protein L3049_11650 [Labilibaculum sp. DW002]|uniref:Internalin n=1 Tax=Paralabilibaculum antarcticum TaxID=2912572 RepID=A0ABT5VV23_9BACT|nr:hypothetical protein [Labilibaculum sp. DW002]MDE5418662.1 hypothetical protein [Labilibaculum sp. DW002]